MTTTALARARAGDGEAFRELTDPHRRELQLHCYRILGSVQDAEDMLQETLLAAWRGLGQFEERASVRSWLYKIATNRCLNALRDTGRRPAAVTSSQGLAAPPEPTRRTEPLWLQPCPDALLDDLPDNAPGPEARYETREAVALALVAGLQRTMPPEPLEYQGHAVITEFFRTRMARWGTRVPRLVPTRANDQPAFGYYLTDPHEPAAHGHSLIMLPWPATGSAPSPGSVTTLFLPDPAG